MTISVIFFSCYVSLSKPVSFYRAKIKNIEATEEAKQKLLQERLRKKDGPSMFVPTNMAVNFVQHNRCISDLLFSIYQDVLSLYFFFQSTLKNLAPRVRSVLKQLRRNQQQVFLLKHRNDLKMLALKRSTTKLAMTFISKSSAANSEDDDMTWCFDINS